MSGKHYGELAMETIIDTCLNSVVWIINHVLFGFPSFKGNLEDFCSFLAGISILLFLHEDDIKYLLALSKWPPAFISILG